MKTLADMKKKLQIKGILVRSRVINSQGAIVLVQPFAPVGHVQSNAFTLLRNDKKSWCEFGKAGEWEFSEKTAKKRGALGGYLELEFSE
jgi:hypothetical protein